MIDETLINIYRSVGACTLTIFEEEVAENWPSLGAKMLVAAKTYCLLANTPSLGHVRDFSVRTTSCGAISP
jgi:hypothetical protein